MRIDCPVSGSQCPRNIVTPSWLLSVGDKKAIPGCLTRSGGFLGPSGASTGRLDLHLILVQPEVDDAIFFTATAIRPDTDIVPLSQSTEGHVDRAVFPPLPVYVGVYGQSPSILMGFSKRVHQLVVADTIHAMLALPDLGREVNFLDAPLADSILSRLRTLKHTSLVHVTLHLLDAVIMGGY